MASKFVIAYARRTGREQRIPEHWLEHPQLRKGFTTTPPGEKAERRRQRPPRQTPSTTTATTPAAAGGQE
jgi:hypothetical protein